MLAGYLAAHAEREDAGFALPAVLLVVGALAIASYLRSAADHAGATTEAAAIVAPLLGVLVARGEPLPAMSLAVLVTLLLTLKAPLHKIAGSVSEAEVVAVLKFAIVAVVLLPLLPDTPMGPYGALVPRHLGLVVVTLCGISLAGYLLVRLLGGGAGWPLVGALGGLVSSTAVTLALSGKARTSEDLARPLALGTLLASTVLYGRGLILVALFDSSLAVHLAPRMMGLFAVGGLATALLRREQRGEARGEVALGNPVELSRAVGLGILFAAVLLGVRAAEAELGRAGVWSAGALGGLVDVDSVALAVARLHKQGFVEAGTAANAFLLATVSNLFVKGAIVMFVGGRRMARLVLPVFALLATATLALLLV